MADYGPGYDPSQADYISASDQAIGGLISLAAFALISVGGFLGLTDFTWELVELPSGNVYPVGLGGITIESATAVDLVTTGQVTGAAAAAIMETVIAELEGTELDSVEAIISLDAYNPDTDFEGPEYDNFTGYLDPDGGGRGCFDGGDDMCLYLE